MLPDNFHLQLGTWHALKALAGAVRTAVFVHEQAIPASEEWDAADETALHAVITDAQGRSVATGRLLQPEAGLAQVGRMAVSATHRGQHLGAAVLHALCAAAQARGDTRMVLHAQRSAEGFYRRYGFEAQGEPYDEVGIPHITMSKEIAEAA